ncbi:hypothetical protein RA280_09825 [Cupriavidus sp. CV2]|uniref:hypothetical protein n=1 Tax=Cupriavidus ulmosensis TaxID=3065913 RepID=UPI00296ABF11|nr:hypothetical protein [Cupriavidus sp. CV2]MDW3682045.1 hypothetical protein [Cupriavidus sp. CV2]
MMMPRVTRLLKRTAVLARVVLVSTRAVVDARYANPPANGSELVLFDLNHDAHLGPPGMGEGIAQAGGPA